jgi:hypothetical protein
LCWYWSDWHQNGTATDLQVCLTTIGQDAESRVGISQGHT